MSEEDLKLKEEMDKEYSLIPMNEIDREARILAVSWGDEFFPGEGFALKAKLASDFVNYAKRANKAQIAKIKAILDAAIEEVTNHIKKLDL